MFNTLLLPIRVRDAPYSKQFLIPCFVIVSATLPDRLTYNNYIIPTMHTTLICSPYVPDTCVVNKNI